jgi:hypothetical protein
MAHAAHKRSDTANPVERKLGAPILNAPISGATTSDATIVPGGPGYVYVLPKARLKDKTRPSRLPRFDPIAAAESHVERMAIEFSFWLEKEEKALRTARDRFLKSPGEETAFEDLHRIVHTIKGNAPVLGCEAAGILAAPLSTAMERCTDHKKVQATFQLALTAICSALKSNIPANDPDIVEMAAMLNALNSTCELNKTQAAGKASNCSSSACSAS